MKKIKRIFTIIASLALTFIFLMSLVACGNKEPIACDFQFINPETGEHIKPNGTMGYNEIYLTYDGTQKNVEVITVRRDNGEKIQFLEDIDVSYTYTDPKTGNKEYGKPYMLEKGEYTLCINDCSYDEDKYFISPMGVYLTIYLQEEDAAKDIELNNIYSIDVRESNTQKLSFTAPYSMTYSINIDDASYEIYNSYDELIKEASGESLVFVNKGETITVKISDSTVPFKTSVLIQCSPEIIEFSEPYHYEIKTGQERIFKFSHNVDDKIYVKTGNGRIEAAVYNSNGRLVYVSSNSDGYEYTANEELYIVIYCTDFSEIISGEIIIENYDFFTPNDFDVEGSV